MPTLSQTFPAAAVLNGTAPEPRIWCAPSEWDPQLSEDKFLEMVSVAEMAGLVLDPWQEADAELLTLTRGDGKWAAFQHGVHANRQNGKGSIIEARQLAGLFVWREPLQVYTAHEYKTAQEMFRRIAALVEGCPTLDREVASMPWGEGNEAIELKNGCRLKFLARSPKTGRGFTGDTVYLDEAYGLTPQMMGALMPTMSARTVTANPQIIYASSAGMVNSMVWRGVRERAMYRPGGRFSYAEWSVRAWEELSKEERAFWGTFDRYRRDPGVWAVANPSMGVRISEEWILEELEGLTEEEFTRERLGIWERLSGAAVIPAALWEALEDDDAEDDLAECTVAVDVPPSQDSAVIAMAGVRPGETRLSVWVVDQREGTAWVVERLKELQENHRARAVVYDPGGMAGALETAMQKAHIRRLRPLRSVREYAQACGQFYALCDDRQLRHPKQDHLTLAVNGAAKRDAGTDGAAWTWSRRHASLDISPLVAATLAAHGLLAAMRRRRDDDEERPPRRRSTVVVRRR